jgi:hypothetical protein
MTKTAPKTELVLGIIGLVLLSIVLGALIGDSSGTLNRYLGYEVLLLAVLIGLCLFPFIRGISRGNFDIFEPIYLQAGAFFIFYTVGTLITVNSSEYWVGRLNLRPYLTQALFAVVIGLVGFEVGYMWDLFQVGKERTRNREDRSEPYDPNLIFSSALVILILAVIFFIYWLSSTDQSLLSLNSVFSDEKTFGLAGQLGSQSTLYFYKFQRTWPILILLIWAFAPNRFWKLTAVVLWLTNALIYIVGGSRTQVVYLFGATFIFWYLQRKKRPSIFILLVISIAFMWFSAFTVTARSSSLSGPATTGGEVTNELSAELSKRSTLSGLLVTVTVFDRYAPFVGFKIFQEIPIAMIPRSFWPGKPTHSLFTNILTQYVPAGQEAVTPGMLGIYYASFGLPGVFFVFLAFGVLNAFIYKRLMRHPSDKVWQIFFSNWFFFCLVISQRGSPAFFVMEYAYALGPITAVLWLSGARSHFISSPMKPSAELAMPVSHSDS